MAEQGPMTEAMYYILLALLRPGHGYGMMQRIKELSAGRLVMGPGKEYSLMDDSIASEYFLITSVPHERPCRPGFPLDRISLDIRTGKYYYDLEQKDLDQVAVEDGYLTFFQKIFGGDT